MKARELQEYLYSLVGAWQYPADTVDTFKAGDPQTEVRGIAVAWMSYAWALKRAVELRCNVFVTHEPTFYDHFDRDPGALRLPGAQSKRRFIEEHGLAIIRCHDLWDQMRRIGIADAWGELLRLGEAVDGDAFVRVYEIKPITAHRLAHRVAARTRPYGQRAVQLIGPANKMVSRVCIGTGAITPYLKCVATYRIDLAICTDDGIDYWRDGAYAIDNDLPIVVVNHPVSEEMGIQRLAEHLRARFPEIAVHHIPQQCMYQLVKGY
jgi:putative NIF3 family GTP cyclohydrolase 1 type 2